MKNNNNHLNLATIHKDMSKKGLTLSFQTNLEYALAKDEYSATQYDDFLAVAITIRDRLVERWIATQQRYHKENDKRVYYLSMEFLIGRLLGTNVMNLGLWDETKKAMEDLGLDIDELRDLEPDAGLGNAGLGRLAACFLDSMATLGVPAHGYGIRYEYGIFKQKILNGYQVEAPDEWLSRTNPWEFPRQEYAVKVKFHGRTQMSTDSKGRLVVSWVDTDDVVALPYDMPVPGYKNDVVNTLRLWSARSTEEFDLSYFNDGDYERAVYDKVLSENISKVLYPNDNRSQGRELRLKQEYFFTTASIADIIRRFKIDNTDLRKLPEKAAIQLNDTHPTVAIAEMMRVLVDEEGFGWDAAWDITVRTFAYTNHTMMPEALECWPVSLFETMLPRHLQIIYEINMRFLKEVSLEFPGDNDLLRRVSIIEESNPKKVRMAHLAIIGSHSINGVSELHTELLKTRLFRDFYDLYPDRFNNKTNGITQRRWLQKANRRLSGLITEAIGDGWVTDFSKLKKLERFADDSSFRQKWHAVKVENKRLLADYIQNTTNARINPESIFDVQIKRIHEYKRQLLLCFYILSEYIKIKQDPSAAGWPRTFIFSGKTAPSYHMAKMIIKFINSIADIVNNDKAVNEKIRVVFLENYRVSLAERIFPATELSEQISTAGTEASGTGCMKAVANGAVVIGTIDGANIEIAEEVGEDNAFLFGLTADEVQEIRSAGYNPWEYINRSRELGEVLRLIQSNFLSPVEFGLFDEIVHSLTTSDYFLVCADFDPYRDAQGLVSVAYKNNALWTKKSILNVARCGKFSSDRTIREYAKEIWGV